MLFRSWKLEKTEVKPILPYLQNFPKLWSLLTNTEKRAILRIVFASIYFDDHALIRQVSAHAPFDQLLKINTLSLN